MKDEIVLMGGSDGGNGYPDELSYSQVGPETSTITTTTIVPGHGMGGTVGVGAVAVGNVPPVRPNPDYGLMPTNAVITSSPSLAYNQVGVIKVARMGTANSGLLAEQNLLPLMGRPRNTQQNRWQYYTITNNCMRLPIDYQGKDAMDEMGVQEISNGDSVYVSGLGTSGTVMVYPAASYSYNPSIRFL